MSDGCLDRLPTFPHPLPPMSTPMANKECGDTGRIQVTTMAVESVHKLSDSSVFKFLTPAPL
jgi:hypothetical protein